MQAVFPCQIGNIYRSDIAHKRVCQYLNDIIGLSLPPKVMLEALELGLV